MNINEGAEKEILSKWQNKIRQHGQYHEIEIIIAFRMMIKEGYNTFRDMLETLRIVCTHNIYEIEVASIDMRNVFHIDGKYYYISKS